MHAPQSQATDRTAYRPDIDGLRALAVVAVVFYHAFPNAIHGGYIGVDVFFVISGFLISSIIFRELAEGRFSLINFYIRRVRRIFPALAVCLTAVLAYGFVGLLPFELAQLGKHAFFGASFLSNVLLWRESGYFNIAATLKPLLHLWSLAIEEQFYIFWPALLLLSFARVKNFLFLILVLFSASFVINVLLARTHIIADFYLPISRFWEILGGALLAARPVNIVSRRAASILSFSGLAALLGAITLFDAETRFPGWAALLPVAGTMALLSAGPNATVNRLLSNRLAVSVGLISYPLYLWHWPLISFAYITSSGAGPSPFAASALVAVSFVLAWMTYRFVEIPVRFGQNRHRLTKVSAAYVATIGAFGLLLWIQGGFPARFHDSGLLKISQARLDADFKPTKGMTVVDHDRTLVTHLPSQSSRKVAFGGDSLLFHFGPRAQQLADDRELSANVYFVVGGSCAPVPGIIQRDDFAHCANLPDLLADLVEREKVQTVVLGASWSGYDGPHMLISRNGQQLRLDTREGKEAFYANLADFVRTLQMQGAKVYLILGVPVAGRFNPGSMLTRGPLGIQVSPEASEEVPIVDLKQSLAKENAKLQAVADLTGAELLDPLPDICGSGAGCSPFFGSGEPKTSDGMHLRPDFVKDHIHFLDPLLKKTK